MAEENSDFENMDLDDFNLDDVQIETQSSSDDIFNDDGIEQALLDTVAEENPVYQESVTSPFQTEEIAPSEEQSDEKNSDVFLPDDAPGDVGVVDAVYQNDVDEQAEASLSDDSLTSSVAEQSDEVEQAFEPEFSEQEQPVYEPEVSEQEQPVYEQPIENDFVSDTFDEPATKEDSSDEIYPKIEESHNIGFLRWYSGTSTESMFEIKKGFASGRFEANEEQKSIHINTGYDTYGWSVQFADGVVMNLHDVREYQIRNGRLPYSDGRIIYGKSVLEFINIERIVVYESVKYFSYGV